MDMEPNSKRNLSAMASNPLAMASNLLAMASNLTIAMVSNLTQHNGLSMDHKANTIWHTPGDLFSSKIAKLTGRFEMCVTCVLLLTPFYNVSNPQQKSI